MDSIFEATEQSDEFHQSNVEEEEEDIGNLISQFGEKGLQTNHLLI